jgi:hypothetical protein
MAAASTGSCVNVIAFTAWCGPFEPVFWERQMAKEGLDGRHRDTTGRIDKKHGNTRVGSLRKTYGEHFAKGRRKDMMLKTLLAETGTESLHAYLRKHHK